MVRGTPTLALALAVLGPSFPTPVRAEEPVELRAGDVVAGEVGGGERRSYAVRLSAGEYLRAVVSPAGVDVAIAIKGPDGASLLLVDLKPDPNGPEAFQFQGDPH